VKLFIVLVVVVVVGCGGLVELFNEVKMLAVYAAEVGAGLQGAWLLCL